MKYKVLLFVCLLMSCSSLFAQDIIMLRTAEELQTKVVEITTSEVKYRKFGVEDSPLYSINKNDVFFIKYENGTKDIFEVNSTPESSSSNDGGYPYLQADKSYNVGDFINVNGQLGIVVHTTNNGEHGLIMSVSTDAKYWCVLSEIDGTPKTVDDVSFGCDNLSDGWENMQQICKVIDEVNGLGWNNFPAFNWCRNLGEGWYLPAHEELQLIFLHKDVWSLLDNVLRNNGYKSIKNQELLSSTEVIYKSKYRVYVSTIRAREGQNNSLNGFRRNVIARDFPLLQVRAFHKF